MTIQLPGTPSWSRNNDHQVYGGDLNKQDYGNIGPINPKTDVSAAQFCRAVENQSCIERVADFAVLTITLSGSSYTLVSYRSQVGNGTSFVPDVAVTGGDVAVITWDASFQDAYGTDQTITLQDVNTHVHGTALGFAKTEWTAPNELTVTVVDNSDGPLADKTITVRVG